MKGDPSEKVTRLEDAVKHAAPDVWGILPYGYIDHLEVRFAEPIANMDAMHSYEVEVRVTQRGTGLGVTPEKIIVHLRYVTL